LPSLIKHNYNSFKTADIRCVGDFLRICVWAGVVDESAATLSYDEFSRQFLSELDYLQEKENLEQVYISSLDPTAPYIKHGIVLPKVYNNLCSNHVITMSYLPGPKFETEAKRQLALLGIDTSKGISFLREAAKDASEVEIDVTNKNPNETSLQRHATKKSLAAVVEPMGSSSSRYTPLALQLSKSFGKVVGVDFMLWVVRLYRRLILWYTASAVTTIQALNSTSRYLGSSKNVVSGRLEEWAEANHITAKQAQRIKLTESWIHALFDVHGHQLFNLGLFNADPHPGNILIIDEDEEDSEQKQDATTNSFNPNAVMKGPLSTRQLGLIDFGQCKRLTPQEQVSIAQLILSVANNKSDTEVAAAFRNLGIKTKNDSTEFLAKFARLMFGSFKPEHLEHSWHTQLHLMDRITYFPKELSMVYRTSLLLRGLGMSLQINCSIGEEWKHHAQTAIDRYKNK